MTNALFIPCKGPDDRPNVEEVHRLVTPEQHVVLDFEPDANLWNAASLTAFIAGLRRELPDEFSVFCGGGTTEAPDVTILRVIPAHVVIENENAILAVARAFRNTATRLMLQLCQKLSIKPEEFEDPFVRFRLGNKVEGQVDPDWRYTFHGDECRFDNRKTGQVLEVQFGFGAEFGALDPYFFKKFVASTPEYAAVAALFRDDFHDPAHALDVLERRGKLKRITCSAVGERLVVSS